MATSDEKKIMIAFGLYGTLLDTTGYRMVDELKLFEKCLKHDKETVRVIELWRFYQLEYTLGLNSLQQYISFSEILVSSLYRAISDVIPAHACPNDQAFADRVLAIHTDRFSLFQDALAGLEYLKYHKEIEPHILSSGTPDMLSTTMASGQFQNAINEDKAFFKSLLSADAVKMYQPTAAVYYHVAKSVGKRCSEIWFVSNSALDIVGAKNVGMKTCWVGRDGKLWTDQFKGRPDLVAKGVDEAILAIAGLEGMVETEAQKQNRLNRGWNHQFG